MIGHLNHLPVTHVYDQLVEVIRSRKLRTITLDDVFAKHNCSDSAIPCDTSSVTSVTSKTSDDCAACLAQFAGRWVSNDLVRVLR